MRVLWIVGGESVVLALTIAIVGLAMAVPSTNDLYSELMKGAFILMAAAVFLIGTVMVVEMTKPKKKHLKRVAPPGKLRVIGEAPMDDEEYHLGDVSSVEEAQVTAEKFINQNPKYLAATVYNQNGVKQFELGTI